MNLKKLTNKIKDKNFHELNHKHTFTQCCLIEQF